MASYMVSAAGISPAPATSGAFNPSTLAATLITTAGACIAAYSTGNLAFAFAFIAWAAVGVVWSNALLSPIIGFPTMLSDMGVPGFITYPLYALWAFLMCMWAFHIMTGRNVEVD